MGEWYYIGHYGQLGPLTREQIDDLIRDGVIARDTYVWKQGMSDWLMAAQVTDLLPTFTAYAPNVAPPPPPSPGPGPSPVSAASFRMDTPSAPMPPMHLPSYSNYPVTPGFGYPVIGGIRSDKSRTAAGVLQLFLPGIGRMYLGYVAYGTIQLVLTVASCGFLWLWSFVDGIIILTGGVKLDGYGRVLSD